MNKFKIETNVIFLSKSIGNIKAVLPKTQYREGNKSVVI
jgi:hypothetical protein